MYTSQATPKKTYFMYTEEISKNNLKPKIGKSIATTNLYKSRDPL